MLPVSFPMKVFRAGLKHQSQRTATFTSLRCIVQRSGNFHFLKRVWIRQRYCIEVRKIEVVDVDSFQRNTIVTRTLTIDRYIGSAAARTTNIRWFPGNTARKGQQEQEVGRSQGQ